MIPFLKTAVRILLLLPAAVAAQTTIQVAALSDYRQRGVSLSQNRPALQATLNYDHESGVFAGLTATNVRLSTEITSQSNASSAYDPYIGSSVRRVTIGSSGIGTQWYAGYAGSITEDLAWEAGAIVYRYPRRNGFPDYDYTEKFVGFSSDQFALRWYDSNDYYGSNVRMSYVEANFTQPFSDHWFMALHAGRIAVHPHAFAASERFDYRLGLGFRMQQHSVIELAWNGASATMGKCPLSPSFCQPRAVLTFSRGF